MRKWGLPSLAKGERSGASRRMALCSGLSLTRGNSAINFFAVAYGKDNEGAFQIIDRINNAVISDSDSVAIGLAQLLRTMGARIIGQGQEAGFHAGANEGGKLGKLRLSAADNGNSIIHAVRLALSSERNCLIGRAGSLMRLSAIAKSIKSSRNFLSWTMRETNSSWTRWGKAWKAVRNTSAVAWAEVMFLV